MESASHNSALEKRIKRHVVGRVREYFAATAPGFESLCLQELRALPSKLHNARTCPGGILFQGRLADCYLANLYLRTATRVLMRIDSFTASRFYELERKASELPWELFLNPGTNVEFRIRAKHSRLYHSGAIADRFRSSISGRLSSQGSDIHQPARSDLTQQVFIRVVDNRFTVSLDSSGINLHKRGIKKTAADAPMRETTAAAVLMLAGYAPPEPLIDPMCGSGTFSMEAAMLASNIPAGFYRDFAFTNWPAYRQTKLRWQHMKSEAQKRISIPKQTLVLASDAESRNCHAFKKTVAGHPFETVIDIVARDFFDLVPPSPAGDIGLVVINPPYGRRLGSAEGVRSLTERIANKLKRDFPGWKFALILPARKLLKQLHLSAKVFPILHGGLRVYAAVGRIYPSTDSGRSQPAKNSTN